jgi:hypothetical protein
MDLLRRAGGAAVLVEVAEVEDAREHGWPPGGERYDS